MKKEKALVVQPKAMIGGTLKPYQVEGLRWLATLFENGLSGILADEMGLGKTIQVIALVAHVREKNVKGPICIAAPLATRVAASSHHFDGVGGARYAAAASTASGAAPGRSCTEPRRATSESPSRPRIGSESPRNPEKNQPRPRLTEPTRFNDATPRTDRVIPTQAPQLDERVPEVDARHICVIVSW